MPVTVSDRMSKKLLAFVAILAMSGCASTPEDSGADDAAAAAAADSEVAGVEDTSTYGVDSAQEVDSATTAAVVDPDEALRASTTFYFDYDLAQIKASAFEPLKAHARYLVANSAARVRLEGHCDERGTREYNIALGERRANAVEKFLKVQGVSGSQIEVVSYGEERPAALGHDERAWAENRRVELMY